MLAALLTQANQAVSIDSLSEFIWDGAPPSGSARTVRVYAARLRHTLGPSASERIVTQAPGYLCRVGRDELDVLLVEELSEQAAAAARERDWARATNLLADALALWRGTPLADVPSEQLRVREVPRLDRLHLRAVEGHVTAEMNLDRHEQLIPQLRELTANYPLHENFHAQLMTALARTGRRAEALEAYREARRVLVEEVGIEPGPALRATHQRILSC
jgi:DNA-binding SARP family transcriptional activator